jgi:hypothetical protein
VPPFDITDYPSPLQSFRGYVRDDADKTLFTVTGLPKDGRVRLATMDAYDGIVYNVSDDGPALPARSRRSARTCRPRRPAPRRRCASRSAT